MKALYSDENNCFLCPKKCVINEGKLGFCKTRKNIGGTIHSLSYGRPVGLSIDPIEKKPLYHFHPNKKILSFGTIGCNLDCLGCQNHEMSRGDIDEKSQIIEPSEIIRIAKENKIDMIAYTYNEPTVFFEYMLDVAKLAKKNGIKNIVVSNGFIEEKPLKELIPNIDAFNIDLKFIDKENYIKYASGLLNPVLNSLKIINNSNAWLEITNLIIPNWNDDLTEVMELCNWIKNNLGKDVPVHFSAFYPNYKLLDIPITSEIKLKEIEKIAKQYLNYVYLGNIGEKPKLNCHKCNSIFERIGFNGVCRCNNVIPGVWKSLKTD